MNKINKPKKKKFPRIKRITVENIYATDFSLVTLPWLITKILLNVGAKRDSEPVCQSLLLATAWKAKTDPNN